MRDRYLASDCRLRLASGVKAMHLPVTAAISGLKRASTPIEESDISAGTY